jgi:uncharacterized protein YecT (DUF1311 family)
MKRIPAASLAAFCLFGGAAQAAPSQTLMAVQALAASYDRCVQRAKTNLAFGECGGARLKNGDVLLNATWKRVYGRIKGSSKGALLAEQRLWITYKDRSCQWWLNERGREGQVIQYPLCRAAVIESRIQILAALEAVQ